MLKVFLVSIEYIVVISDLINKTQKQIFRQLLKFTRITLKKVEQTESMMINHLTLIHLNLHFLHQLMLFTNNLIIISHSFISQLVPQRSLELRNDVDRLLNAGHHVPHANGAFFVVVPAWLDGGDEW